MDKFQVIKQPIITERTNDLKENRQVVFKVDIRANKREIKQAVDALFKTKVERVNTARFKGKPSEWALMPVVGQTGRRL